MDIKPQTGAIKLDLEEGGRIKALRVGSGTFSWLDPELSSPVFALGYDSEVHWGNEERFQYRGLKQYEEEDGSLILKLLFHDKVKNLCIECFFRTFPEYGVLEQWAEVTNTGSEAMRLERLDSFSWYLNASLTRLSYFTGLWGHEFTPADEVLDGRSVLLQSTMGRSAGNGLPLFHLGDGQGCHMIGALAWSGNWAIRFNPLNRVSYGSYVYQADGGIHDTLFYTDLMPGGCFKGVHMVMAFASEGGADRAAGELIRWGRQYWYVKSPSRAEGLPVAWNHWWPYEDSDIDEDVFLANVRQAEQMGVELCTLDSGWFGPSGRHTAWGDYRGDWHMVNRERFPGGIETLSREVRERGMGFGLWCEIESVGSKSELHTHHPEFLARRDGKNLGYLCFGSPSVQEWAINTLDRLIRDYSCSWIKIDFNVDAGYGCNETGHGHGRGDGLYAHYQGLYIVLDRIRAIHPEVILENCSSGGLRTDLEMMRHFHIHFLSDPDLPDHNLQLIWGFTSAFAPERALHFPWSDAKIGLWDGFKPTDNTLSVHQTDFYIRTALLNGFGLSHKLPLLPEKVRERFVCHIRLYKDKIRGILKGSLVYRLTEQSLRTGKGQRWAVFQYQVPESGSGIVFVFRLKGGEARRTISFKGLEEDRLYTLKDEDERVFMDRLSGRSLMEEGLTFTHLLEEDSLILFYD